MRTAMQEDDHENEGEECATCDEDEGEGEYEERLEDDGEEGEEEGGEEEEREPSEIQRLSWLLSDALHIGYDAHLTDLTRARAKRREALAFRSAVEDGVGDDRAASTKTLDELEGLGQWMPGDEMAGDVNYRTLQKLLTRVDQRGFERSAQQLEFHAAFMKAAARVIYRENWETEKPVIMKKHGWEKCSSEVLISTPRRFGKTYRCALFAQDPFPPVSRTHVCFSASRSSARALRSRKAWRSSSSRPRGARAASCSNALSSLSRWPEDNQRSASTTRKPVG